MVSLIIIVIEQSNLLHHWYPYWWNDIEWISTSVAASIANQTHTVVNWQLPTWYQGNNRADWIRIQARSSITTTLCLIYVSIHTIVRKTRCVQVWFFILRNRIVTSPRETKGEHSLKNRFEEADFDLTSRELWCAWINNSSHFKHSFIKQLLLGNILMLVMLQFEQIIWQTYCFPRERERERKRVREENEWKKRETRRWTMPARFTGEWCVEALKSIDVMSWGRGEHDWLHRTLRSRGIVTRVKPYDKQVYNNFFPFAPVRRRDRLFQPHRAYWSCVTCRHVSSIDRPGAWFFNRINSDLSLLDEFESTGLLYNKLYYCIQ